MRKRSRALLWLAVLGIVSVIATSCGNGGSSGGSGRTSGTGGQAGAVTGTTGTGGAAPGTGGATPGTGGAAGRATGGSTATGGGGALTSTGCGMTPPALGTANPQMIDVTDNKGNVATRTFYVGLPGNYAASTPSRLIFAWHYAGGQASQIAGTGFAGNYYGLAPMLPAIYIAPQGLTDSSGQTGWPNTNGQDFAFLNAMLSWAESKLCVDTTRIMSTGFSYGGIMSDNVGCQMPDVFRAIGVMSGALFGSASSCKKHNIAVWMTHGTADPTVDISGDQTALNQFLANNHCASTTTAVSPSPCTSYDGCDSGYPVVWCPVDGEGHTIPSFATSAIAAFFGQF